MTDLDESDYRFTDRRARFMAGNKAQFRSMVLQYAPHNEGNKPHRIMIAGDTKGRQAVQALKFLGKDFFVHNCSLYLRPDVFEARAYADNHLTKEERERSIFVQSSLRDYRENRADANFELIVFTPDRQGRFDEPADFYASLMGACGDAFRLLSIEGILIIIAFCPVTHCSDAFLGEMHRVLRGACVEVLRMTVLHDDLFKLNELPELPKQIRNCEAAGRFLYLVFQRH